MTNKARKRERLHARNPCCYYCRVETKLHPELRGGPSPSDLATLEHLDDRFTRARAWCAGYIDGAVREHRVVIACWRCNVERGRDRVDEFVAKFGVIARGFTMRQRVECNMFLDNQSGE